MLQTTSKTRWINYYVKMIANHGCVTVLAMLYDVIKQLETNLKREKDINAMVREPPF